MNTMTTEPPTMTSESLTLINYVEVWTLPENDDGASAEFLQLSHAYAIDHDRTRAVSTSGKNKLGEGVAGSAWKQHGPVILQGENSAVLQHVRSNAGVPITALLAIPVYRDYHLINVIVFGVTDGNGGIEIWTRDERDELAISGSYYEGLPSFEFISQYVRFPKGAGVPGACWKDGRPRIVPQPHAAPGFIRSFDKIRHILPSALVYRSVANTALPVRSFCCSRTRASHSQETSAFGNANQRLPPIPIWLPLSHFLAQIQRILIWSQRGVSRFAIKCPKNVAQFYWARKRVTCQKVSSLEL